MEQTPLVTVIICTYNRAMLLKRTLLELITQEADFPFDILVVDNNSNDKTKKVFEEIRKLSRVQVNYCLEKQQGLSYARNLGAHEARGKYIAYIDDDVIVAKDWLKNLAVSFENQNPKPLCIVGKIELVWEGEKPYWFLKEHETLLGRYDFGNQPKYLGENDYLLTMNVVFEKEIFMKFGKFKTHLGRRGKCLLSGEDNEMYHRLFRAGIKTYYNPDQLVYHFVPRERQGLPWLTRRFFWAGATQVLLDLEGKIFSKTYLAHHMLYDGKIASKSFAKSLYFYLLNKKNNQIKYFFEAILKMGRIYLECLFIFTSKYKKIRNPSFWLDRLK